MNNDMKRVFLIVLSLIMTTVISVAQEHMSFLGIPIEGSIDEFANKLVKEKGSWLLRLMIMKTKDS